MKNLAGLMKQAQDMQTKMAEMQARLEAVDTEGVSGAGMVRVILNGRGDMRAITIDPKLADPAEMEMLGDLIIAAHRDAKSKSDALTQAEMQKATGGLDIPGLAGGLKLPF
jgi:DNA-binding YbaB/EbfC family protein